MKTITPSVAPIAWWPHVAKPISIAFSTKRCGQADAGKMAALSSSPSKVTTAKIGGGITRSSSSYTQLAFCSRHPFQKAATTAAAFHKLPSELALLSPARNRHARTCPAATENDQAAPAAAQEASNTPPPAMPSAGNQQPSANGSPPQEPPKRVPLTARERLRAARVLGKYAEPGGSATPGGKAPAKRAEFGSRVLDALRDADGGKKKRSSRLPEAPSNMLDDSKRGLSKGGWTFEALPFGTDVFVIVVSFSLITALMFGTTYLVWKLGAIHFNEY